MDASHWPPARSLDAPFDRLFLLFPIWLMTNRELVLVAHIPFDFRARHRLVSSMRGVIIASTTHATESICGQCFMLFLPSQLADSRSPFENFITESQSTLSQHKGEGKSMYPFDLVDQLPDSQSEQNVLSFEDCR